MANWFKIVVFCIQGATILAGNSLLYVYKTFAATSQVLASAGDTGNWYLDDGMVAEEGETKERETSLIVQRNLVRAGFITNIAKCHWEPSTSMYLAWL